MILPLNSPHAQLENAGGKGANLSRLVRAGLPVPDGFIITTEAYQKFVDENYLGDRILQRVSKIQSQDSSALEEASEEIRSWFVNSNILQQIATQTVDAYQNLGETPVAVRSSATAEDLPELSFAGQHDTYLNILGTEALLEAMLNCWSSLWTARAIGYRSRNNIPHAEISLAVVVQKMIPSESSGILFTANPLTGLRTESVIDATLGLGEALVAGHVEPDHYVVDQKERVIISKSLGSKKIAMHGKSDGGVVTEEIEAQKTQALPDEEILSLVDLGGKVADLFKFSQDIEWGYSNEDLVLLQSRPITSLFPIPEGMSTVDLRVLISFASIQGIMEPMTPLGQDTIHMIFAGGASLFGYDLIPGRQGLFKPAGERLWGDITAVIRHPIGSRLVLRFLTVVDPVAQTNLAALKEDPGLAFGKGQLRFATFRRLFRFVYPFLKRVFHYIRSPQGTAEQINQASQVEIARIKGKSEAWQEAVPTLDESLALYREIYNAFPFAIPEIATGAAGGLIPFFLLNKIATHLTGSSDLGLEITRGLPNNVTTEMDLELWETACRIRSDEIAHQHFLDSNQEILAREYLNIQLPEIAQSNLTKFLKRYGMRGLGEIDIGRKRWNEDPTYVFEVLLQYMKIEDRSLAPDVVFKKGEQAAEEALKDLQEIARSTFAGGLKAAVIKKLALRVRELAGLRENPKFYIIQMMGIIRQALLATGNELVAAGTIEKPDDLFYLKINELEELAEGGERNWGNLISKRRAAHNRELTRVQIPRLLLSDGRAYYEGLITEKQGGAKLTGSPVSPGIVEGSIRVVTDPLNADMLPGEIMVCQGTDPAWTPLFLTAGGLIMEVGGMMTHGAIVAREYGIPAVVGVHQATTTLQTGQEIRLNGSTGEIYLADG